MGVLNIVTCILSIASQVYKSELRFVRFYGISLVTPVAGQGPECRLGTKDPCLKQEVGRGVTCIA